MKNPSQIKNKVKRTQVYAKYKAEKSKVKKRQRDERAKQEEELGALAPPRQIPRTIENTRVKDETMIQGVDDEIAADEKDDEFSQIFNNTVVCICMLCYVITIPCGLTSMMFCSVYFVFLFYCIYLYICRLPRL